ncbi:unnamed protein product, partial [Ectocarpus sp. 12 AP-2014]
HRRKHKRQAPLNWIYYFTPADRSKNTKHLSDLPSIPPGLVRRLRRISVSKRGVTSDQRKPRRARPLEEPDETAIWHLRCPSKYLHALRQPALASSLSLPVPCSQYLTVSFMGQEKHKSNDTKEEKTMITYRPETRTPSALDQMPS